MPIFPWKLVTIDIDGTLTRVHGWRFLARTRGLEDQWRRSTAAYLRRERSEDAHLRDLLDLAEGLDREQLHKILSATPKLRGIHQAVNSLHRRGSKVALLTHNPPFVVDWWRAQYGFDDADGILSPPRFRRGRVPAPGRVRADKKGGLRRLLARLQLPAKLTVHVGDGRADAELFHLVGAGVALNSQDEVVESAADLVLHLTDLRKLVPALSTLVPAKK